MSRAGAALAGRMVFNVGARRSGTYWLQRIVAAHPAVAAVPSETHLISHGVAPLVDRFHQGAPDSPAVGAMFADRETVIAHVRALCDAVLFPYLGDRELLAERTPLHVHHLPLIHEIYPEAKVIHIIRDGYDVAASLLRQSWGPATVAEAAEEWRSGVEDARGARLPGEVYVEVGHEALADDPGSALPPLFEWLGLGTGAREIEPVLSEAAVRKNLGRRPGAAAGGLTDAERAEFDEVAGELRVELGYGERSGRGGRRPSKRASRPRRGPLYAQSLLDHAVTALRSGATDELRVALGDSATVELLTDEGSETHSGESAAEAAARFAADDPALQGEPLPGGSYPARPWSSALLCGRSPQGPVTYSLIFARLGDGRIEELVYRRLGPAG